METDSSLCRVWISCILKHFSVSACVRILCTREANKNTWGAWASSGKELPHCLLYNKDKKTPLHFISASKILNVKLRMSWIRHKASLISDGFVGEKQRAAPVLFGFCLKYQHPKFVCLWRLHRNQKSESDWRLLHYYVHCSFIEWWPCWTVGIAELWKPHPQLILFYWSSCLSRKTLCWTFICLFPLRGWTNTNSNSLNSGIHTYTHTSWLLSAKWIIVPDNIFVKHSGLDG